MPVRSRDLRVLIIVLAVVATSLLSRARADIATVRLERVPDGGLQPQIVVREGIWHLTYFKGDPKHGDVFYARSMDEGKTWSTPLRVNSQAGSAIAMGTIRGAVLTVGKGGRIHVVWNGSDRATPRVEGGAPVLYARLDDSGSAFEAQRNLLQNGFDLDGGAAVAADDMGRVYVAWHASTVKNGSEATRKVFLTRSEDEGITWSTPVGVSHAPDGVCSCCQLAITSAGNEVALLYRSESDTVNRDCYLLQSSDAGKSFTSRQVQPWQIGSCPMSSFSLTTRRRTTIGAWETAGKVFWSPLAAKEASRIPSGSKGTNQKHPRLAVNARDEVLLAWSENMAWARGGSLHWQIFDAADQPGESGSQNGVPVWSFPAVAACEDGGFTILY